MNSNNTSWFIKKYATEKGDVPAIHYLKPTQSTNILLQAAFYAVVFFAAYQTFNWLYAACITMLFISAYVYISRRFPSKELPIYEHYTFKDVDQMSDNYYRQLRNICKKKRARVLLLTPITLPELFPLAVGLMKNAMTMIVLGPHETGYAQFVRWIPKLQIDIIITTPFLFLLVQVMAFVLGPFIRISAEHVIYMKKESTVLTLVNRLFFPTQKFFTFDDTIGNEKVEPIDYQVGETCCITNTTGSTGNPKLVHITHDMVYSQMESFTEMVASYRNNQQDSCLSTNTVMTICINCMGLTAIMPPVNVTALGSVDPDLYLWSVEKFKPRFAFCSPIVWNKVINHISQPGYDKIKLAPPLELLLCGGAPVSLAQHRRLKQNCCSDEQAKSKAQLFTPYGATEALPLCVIGTNEILSLSDTNYNGINYGIGGVCVGRTCKNVTMKLQWNDPWNKNVQLPPNIGEIWVSGKAVSPRYEMDNEANAKFKRVDDDMQLWHCTGDVGYFDDEKRVWFCGRRSHMFVLSRTNVAVTPVCIEQVFLNHFPEQLRRCALVGHTPVDNAFENALLVVEPYDWNKCPTTKELEKCFVENVDKLLPYWKEHLTGRMRYLISKVSLPVDPRHNSKIERIKITRLYSNYPLE
jgi:acyl-CoA synthetase (AMP-forming)/AMP-acid ligase II